MSDKDVGVSAACPATARSWQLRHRPACREDARPEEASPSPTRPNSQFRSRACPALAAACRRFKFNFHTPPLRFRLSSTELGVHLVSMSLFSLSDRTPPARAGRSRYRVISNSSMGFFRPHVRRFLLSPTARSPHSPLSAGRRASRITAGWTSQPRAACRPEECSQRSPCHRAPMRGARSVRPLPAGELWATSS